jgi:O-antigen ligase
LSLFGKKIAFAGWVILALYDASYRVSLKKSPILIVYSLFIVVLFFADLFGVDRVKSFWSNFERMEGFVGHIHLYLYFFVLMAMVRTLGEWQKLWKYFIAADIIVLIYGYGQLLGAKGLFFANHFPSIAEWFSRNFQIHMSQNRLDSTLGNSAYFGVFCLMYVFILAIIWSQHAWSKQKWGYPALIVLNIIGVLYSGTRGSMIGLFVGGVLTLAILAWKDHGKTRKYFLRLLPIILILISSVFIFKDTSFVKGSSVLSRIASISPNDVTGSSRLSMWKISYDAWKEKPLLGYGQDNFSYIFARKFMPEKMCNLEPWYDRSHDVFFDWLVAAGALGLITYLSLYGVAMWFMWKQENGIPLSEKALLTGALVGYFIHNVFVFDNLISYILFFTLLAYITVRSRKEALPTGHQLVNNDNMNLLIIPVVGLGLLITLYCVNYRPIVANHLVIRAMSLGEYAKTMPFADAVKLSQDSFTQAIAMNTLGSEEAREQFLQMAVRVGQIKLPDTLPQGDKQAAVTAINNYLLAARKDILASFEEHKEDVRMLSIYGMFFNGTNDPVSAETALKQAYQFAPNKQLLAFDLVRSLLMQKKFTEAYDLALHTYDLSITCNDALKWYMMAAAYAGKYDEAHAYAVSKGQTPVVDVDTIAGVVNAGQVRTAISMLEEYKKANPTQAVQIDAYINQLLAGKK